MCRTRCGLTPDLVPAGRLSVGLSFQEVLPGHSLWSVLGSHPERDCGALGAGHRALLPFATP